MDEYTKTVLKPDQAWEIIFSDGDFQEKIRSYAKEHNIAYDECIKLAKQYLYEIAGDKTENKLYWRFSKWITKLFIARKFNNIKKLSNFFSFFILFIYYLIRNLSPSRSFSELGRDF